MEKQKRWQLYLIVAVLLLTLYNILPTIIYYSKPLNEPVDAKQAHQVAENIIQRVDSLEEQSEAWLTSFAKLLHVHPESIALSESDPRIIEVAFKNATDANQFRRFLPTAGALIPFTPSQLRLARETDSKSPNIVYVERNIGVHLEPKQSDELFQFSSLATPEGQVAPLYRDLVYDRMVQVALSFAETSLISRQIAAIVSNPNDPQFDELAISLARDINEITNTFRADSDLAKRYYASFTQTENPDKDGILNQLVARLDMLRGRSEEQIKKLTQEEKSVKENGGLLDASQSREMALQEAQLKVLDSAVATLKNNLSAFKAGLKPPTRKELLQFLHNSSQNTTQALDISGYNPYVQIIVVDWTDNYLDIRLYPDVQKILESEGKTELNALAKEKLEQLVINEMARASRSSEEAMLPNASNFRIVLNKLTDAQSFLSLQLGMLAAKQEKQISSSLLTSWQPKYPDLTLEAYPIRSYDAYLHEKPEEKKLGLVVYAPAMHNQEPPEGFRMNSVYVIAKGLGTILQKYREMPESEGGQTLVDDFNHLQTLLQQNGFIGYPGSSYGIAPEFHKDYIFELSDYYGELLKATREDFTVKGSKRFAILEFTNLAQRILTENKIADSRQEDLLKWKEAYHTAQVDLNVTSRYTVPPPTKNVFWENFKLSFIKYFRGDERKVLKWGLDLSGGKTVRIGLRDQNNRPVTNPEDLKQAVNELYNRVNKMGVAERTIRIEGDTIVLDFPGSQAFSASELVKAAAMYFHIVNEKFSPGNSDLALVINKFLQEVWNEAVITNRKDLESINEIAWKHFGGDGLQSDIEMRPRSENARILYENGLRLANPKTAVTSSAFNDSISSIAVLRGDEPSEWQGQTHPLLFVFRNYALEGSSLENIQVGYDPSEGNILMFGVKKSYGSTKNRPDSHGSPRDDFYVWTSQFAEDKIAGTPKEGYSRHGWRMAVILNGKVITAPTLRAALRDSATISGRFSQREINQLAADLKAGSLSFTPRILSEQNVSPELGREERLHGIAASLIALIAVGVTMIGYYRFAGVVAFCAVLINLLIMWGVLQSIGAALTLPGIAGLVLTIATAVDANVLVFERFREEFAISGRIGSAIQAGYRKAFNAIIDSNITTLIAALILIQFDSGPIKGFAVVLIIGIVASMFTALFMTRYFFAGWVQNPKHKELKMGHLIGKTNFDFLSKWKPAVIISVIVLVFGSYLLFTQRNTIFGMDFTGGYSLTLDLQEQAGPKDYRLLATEALLAAGATSGEVQVRELSRPNQLRIQMGISMEEKGHPFHGLPEEQPESKFTYDYEKNPRIKWVVDTLAKHNLQVQPSQLADLDKQWTVMSGQLSDAMRNNAVMALALALFCILIYITFRFEFKFAVAAVIGLVHDVLITLGIAAVFHEMGFPVQIDLQVVGAIMMIIGYSLNDTIIVFDRVREDIKLLRKWKFEDILNHALNVTLSRTIMTVGTTLLVLLSLVLFGGSSMFGFSLVMLIGVVVGTMSSLFVAAPVLLYFHNREVKGIAHAES